MRILKLTPILFHASFAVRHDTLLAPRPSLPAPRSSSPRLVFEKSPMEGRSGGRWRHAANFAAFLRL